MNAPFRLYLDSSRRLVLKEGDRAAAFLLAAAGEAVDKKYDAAIAALMPVPDAIQETSEPVAPKKKKHAR